MTSHCNINIIKNFPDRDIIQTNPGEVDAFKDIVNGARSCLRSESTYNAWLGWGSGSIKGPVSMSMSCENVGVVIDILHSSRKQLACVLKNHSTSLKNATRMYQSLANIKIRNVTCKAFHSQDLSENTLVLTTQLPEQDINIIKNILHHTVEKVLSTIQYSKERLGASIIDNKSFQMSIIHVDDLFESDNITYTIEQILKEASVRQGITIDIDNLSGDLCGLGNESVLNLIAQSMIDATMHQIFTLDAVREYVSNTSTKQKATTSGHRTREVTNDRSSLISAILVGVLLCWLYNKLKKR